MQDKQKTELIDDLYAYNDWANNKVLSLCDGLTNEQLDASREMGFGTLRATLFHILTAEQVWMERWKAMPWRTFPTDPAGMSVEDFRGELNAVARQRRALIDEHRTAGFSQRVSYQDSKKTPYDHVLLDLLLHVANHGVHHRAQALNYLKQYERTVPGGIDYIFYRLATGSVKQSCDTVIGLREYGLGVSKATDEPCPYDGGIVKRLFQYHDWATECVLDMASELSDESLDRDFQMGPGSIRKTLLHTFNAERWWQTIWTTGPTTFPPSRSGTSIADMRQHWQTLAPLRNEFLAALNQEAAQRVVEVQAGGPPTRYRIGTSVIQMPLHAIHHRAQLINMFRQVGAPWKNIDLLYAIGQM